MFLSYFSSASIAALLFAGFTAAQDIHPVFVTGCKQGAWALTFDDGPSAFTPELLGYLREADIKATFFVLGIQLSDAKLANGTKAAFDDGHLIASHTYDHQDLNTLTATAIRSQMTRTEALFKQILGYTPRFMRPPYGNCNAACAQVLQQMNYTIFTWNVDSNDWRYVGTPDESKAFDAFVTALANPKASTGFQSLQHDIHQFSVKMTPKIIAAIKAAGLEFVTVDECVPVDVDPYLEGNPPGFGDATEPPATATSKVTPATMATIPTIATSATTTAQTLSPAPGGSAASSIQLSSFSIASIILAGLLSATFAWM